MAVVSAAVGPIVAAAAIFDDAVCARAGFGRRARAQHFFPRLGQGCAVCHGTCLLFILPADLWGAFAMTVPAIFLLLRWAAMRRLGGFTGDVAGAQVELVEVALLLVLASRSVA
ncbi:MAG: adenosylcobinamide-GDP ribazoletransferase [Haliea sp.]|nr:adenosylcobinamide-GDP ribazoletransferase [Haliea sp.]